MTWDIPQFRALLEGLSDYHDNDGDAKVFAILADAFDETNDERGRYLRGWLKRAQSWRTSTQWRSLKKYVSTLTYLHPYEYALRNSYAYWEGVGNRLIDMVLPGQVWNYEKSVLKIARLEKWHLSKRRTVIRKLRKLGIEFQYVQDDCSGPELSNLVTADLNFESIVVNPKPSLFFNGQYLGQVESITIHERI